MNLEVRSEVMVRIQLAQDRDGGELLRTPSDSIEEGEFLHYLSDL
jgi:hypothetical protein